MTKQRLDNPMHYYRGIGEKSDLQVYKLHYIHPHEIFTKDNITCTKIRKYENSEHHCFWIIDCAKIQMCDFMNLNEKGKFKLSKTTYPYVKMMSVNTLDFESIELQSPPGNTIERLTPELIKPMLSLYSLPEMYHSFYVIPFWMSIIGFGYYNMWQETCIVINGPQEYQLKYKLSVGNINSTVRDYELSFYTPLLKVTKEVPESQLICAVITKEHDSDEYILNKNSVWRDNKKTDETITIPRTNKVDSWSIYSVIDVLKLDTQYRNLYDFKTYNDFVSFTPDEHVYYVVPYKFGYISGLFGMYPMSKSFRISKEEEDHILRRDKEETKGSYCVPIEYAENARYKRMCDHERKEELVSLNETMKFTNDDLEYLMKIKNNY